MTHIITRNMHMTQISIVAIQSSKHNLLAFTKKNWCLNNSLVILIVSVVQILNPSCAHKLDYHLSMNNISAMHKSSLLPICIHL
jgi:hypothetical protein